MRSTSDIPRTTAVAWALLIAVAARAWAGNTGSLRIEVVDPEGVPVTSAQVTITDPANQSFKVEGSTNEKGRVDLLGLPPRPFVFLVNREGFVSYASNFLAVAGERTERKVTLQRAGAASGSGQAGGGDSATSAYNDAVLHYRADRLPEALASVEAALEARPKEPGALALKGIILEASGRCAEAIAPLEGAAAATPPRKEALLPLIRCLEAAGRKDEAEQRRKLLASLGRSTADLYNEAVTRINEGNDAAAAVLLEEALSLDQSFAPAHYQHALIQMRRGDAGAAVSGLERYIALAPDGEFAADAHDLLAALKP